jgi:hypothetical protein
MQRETGRKEKEGSLERRILAAEYMSLCQVL